MKILLCSTKGDGPWFVWLMAQEGNEVDWYAFRDKDKETLSGIVPPPLESPDPENYDLVVFDGSGHGSDADAALEVTPVIGSSRLSDKLEKDRIFGLEAMEQAGIRVPAWECFDSISKGIAYVEKSKKRYVFKPCSDKGADMTYVGKNSEDMVRFMEKAGELGDFVLQEFVQGTEISTEAWFNGEDWCALNHTLEEKKFMSGGVGPNTGCAGNTVWMPTKPNQVFARGLDKIKPFLAENGYRGMMDLNTIATEGELYGLEWTPRFGYEGTCNLTRLLPIPFGEFMYRVATGQPVVQGSKHRFSSTLRLSVPPYPNAEKHKERINVPVEGVDLEKLEAFYLSDVRLRDGHLETLGGYQCVGCPVSVGETLQQSFVECKAAIAGLNIPNLQWRNDVPECVERRYNLLELQGWFRDA